MGDTVLWVENLSKQFQKSGESSGVIDALQDISFTLKAGEVCGIIGSNGAGKSTLLKILSEITPPTSGRVRYRGGFTSILNVGTGFHPDLTGRENIFLKGQLLGMTRRDIERKFDEIVAFSGIESFLGSQVKHYSDGMYLRLAFSVAFHSPAALLYLDEVVSVGDAQFRIKAHEKVREVIRNGTTIVMVSHQMSEITDLCTQVAFLEKGRLEMIGATMPVVETYMDRVLAGIGKELIPSEKGFYKVHEVEVSAVGKPKDAEIWVGEAIEIRVDIEKFVAGISMELVLFLVDINGFKILTDSYGMRKNYKPIITESGRFQISATIPANLLNRGIYRIHLTVCRNENEVLDHFMDAVSFQVRMPAEERDEIRFFSINSVLRVPLKWEFQNE